jgi:sarcosine oxidase subunit beta
MRLPIYRDQELLGGYTAWATLTPDGLPIVGEVPSIKGLYVVAGLTGNDFHLAPSIGEGLAQMIVGQPVSAFDPAALAPGRFDS